MLPLELSRRTSYSLILDGKLDFNAAHYDRVSHLNAQVPIWRCIRPANKQQAPLISAQVHSPCFIVQKQKKAKCNVVGNSNSNHSHRAVQWAATGAPLTGECVVVPVRTRTRLPVHWLPTEKQERTSRPADLCSNTVSLDLILNIYKNSKQLVLGFKLGLNQS